MNKSTFKASQWFLEGTPGLPSAGIPVPTLSSTMKQGEINQERLLKHYLIPGWQGEGLLSKEALHFKKLLHRFADDAYMVFVEQRPFNRSLKHAIFQNFSSFAYAKELNCFDLENVDIFWTHLFDPNSIYRADLDQFIKLHSFRSALTYIFKLRFATALSKKTSISLEGQERSLNSYLTKVFKKGRYDLFAPSLLANEYSWYTPRSSFSQELEELQMIVSQLSITELMKISVDANANDKNKTSLACTDRDYSHALSHTTFGLFTNLCLINIPEMLSNSSRLSKSREIKTISVKFAGNYLKSLSLSHWLAQNASLDREWKEILSPEFMGTDYRYGQFIKNCHELQFMSFLVDAASAQKQEIIPFIAKVMREKYQFAPQSALFQEELPELTYDRVVLTEINLPKKNPHQALLTSLQAEIKSVTEGGYLTLFTSQQLFLPSKSSRLENLFKALHLEAILDLHHLSGKGELPTFIYLFKKISRSEIQKQTPCLHFHLSGELTMFNKFAHFVTGIEEFLNSKNCKITPFYKRELADGLTLKCHQDILIEGRILHSMNADHSNITHPRFLDTLSDKMRPLEQIFRMSAIKTVEDLIDSSPLNFLGIESAPRNIAPYFLFVNETHPEALRISIHEAKELPSKMEEFGGAYFKYFALLPKIPNTPILLLNEFFKTSLGRQILQLSLNGQSRDLKNRLKGILVPKFLFNLEMNAPTFLQLQKSQEECATLPAQELLNIYNAIENAILTGSIEAPLSTLTQLILFQKSVKSLAKSSPRFDQNSILLFSNDQFINKLSKLKTYSIYPNQTDDLYMEFMVTTSEAKSLLLTHVQLCNVDSNVHLKLFSNNIHVVSLYSDLKLLQLAQFILQATLETPVLEIFYRLELPRIKAYRDLIEMEEESSRIYPTLLSKLNKVINQIFITQLSPQASK